MVRSPNFYRGLVLGAGLMYILDPSRGRTRRARIRDQITGALGDSRAFLDDAVHDLQNRGNRAGGVVARATAAAPPGPDEAIAERVRAKLDRYVTHPGAVSVEARDGSVTLNGPILRGEAESLIGAVSSVRGVREVLNRLEPHDAEDEVPEFRGSRRHRAFDSVPAMPAGLQFLAGVLGATAVAYGAGRIAARVRAARVDELEREMPEYAMLR
jgi:hypothetical protein